MPPMPMLLLLPQHLAASSGTGSSDFEQLEQILEAIPQVKYICLDVANGYSEHFVEFVKDVRKHFPGHTIMVCFYYPVVSTFLSFFPSFVPLHFYYINLFILCCILIFLVCLIMLLGDYPRFHKMFIGYCNLWLLIHCLCKSSVPDITHPIMMCLCIVHICDTYLPAYRNIHTAVLLKGSHVTFYFFTSLEEWW